VTTYAWASDNVRYIFAPVDPVLLVPVISGALHGCESMISDASRMHIENSEWKKLSRWLAQPFGDATKRA
jgi:hypothetical protein